MKTIKQSQSRRSLWLGLAGGAIALSLLGIGMVRLLATHSNSASQTPSETEAAAPERVEVVALGRIEPRGEVIRVGGPVGERIARLEVAQGDLVATGQVLAVLESYDEQQAQRDYAASQLAEAQARLRATTTYGQAQIQEAQTRVQQVQRPGRFEVNAQEARIRELEAELALAQDDQVRSQQLYQDGAISRQELDQQVSQVRQLEEQLNNAQANLIRLEAQWQEDIRNAQAQLQAEQANLPLSQLQIAVDSAAQNLKLAEARLERTLIRAPQAGRILRILTHAGEAIGQDGSILDMGDTRQMYVVAEVYETDVGLVQEGQTATITSRNGAFEQTLTGIVDEIGWQIFKNNVLDDDPAANADARVVEVKVRLTNGQPVESLTNLQVDVRIQVQE